MNSVHLHQKIVQKLIDVGVESSKPQTSNLAMWSQSLALGDSCHLTKLALDIPLPAKGGNLVQKLRRFLDLGNLTWECCYGKVVEHLLKNWSGQEVPLVLDRTDLGQRWSILVLGVAYRKRLIPLNWQILPFGGTSAKVQIRLIDKVKVHLPCSTQKRLYLYGDCEFRAIEVQKYCKQAGWHWHLGLKGDTYVRLSTGEQLQLSQLGLQPGERRFWQEVYVTKGGYGPVNLMANWFAGQESPRFWAVDLLADQQAWRRGRKRFWIEPTFRDWKSYGFDLERSQVDKPERLHVLLLGISLTTLWMIHLGDWVVQNGHLHLLDNAQVPEYSLFRIGRDYMQRCRTMNWQIPVEFTVSHGY